MADLQFSTGLSRIITVVGYHHILMIFIALAIILLSLLLAGCSSSSPQIPSIFLISLYYTDYTPVQNGAQANPQIAGTIAGLVNDAQLEVRVGYFGICIQPNRGSFTCSQNASALAGFLNYDEDPLNLVWVASTFKDAVVFPYLIIVALILAFLCFILLITFPRWHEVEADGDDVEVLPIPSRPVSQVALALIFVASVFILVSVLWQHTASVAASSIAQDLGNGSVKSGIGTSAMILGWFGFAFLVVVMIGLLFMVLSIPLVARITD
ncbi:hypothetical protein VTO42DRAFT_4362 [Malbranchea cinnamomea]